MSYQCSACNRSFGSQHSLSQHLASAVHTFKCSPCNRTFKSKESYDQHIRTSAIHKPSVPIASNGQSSTATQTQLPQPRNLSPVRIADQPQRDVVTPSSSTSQVSSHTKEGPAQSYDNRWSVVPISQQSALFDALVQNCHSLDDLRTNKYRLLPDTAEDLDGRRKCRNCGGLARNIQKRASAECFFHPESRGNTNQYHGQKLFPCCGSTTRGCLSLPTHDFANPDPKMAVKNRNFAFTPPASPLRPKFRAVTLDCEMATVKGGGNEIIFICAADYFTGAVLLNRLVSPGETITDWRTRIHGITRSAMQTAIREGRALAGWQAAREELWKCIDEDTILVGHALQHDLDVLRIMHARVVDSAILARNAVGRGYPQWGLKLLCDELLELNIRQNAKEVHDCLEDVLATRELVLWCTRSPLELARWAAAKRRDEDRKRERERARAQRRRAQMLAAAESRAASASPSGGRDSEPESASSASEVLLWSDIAESFGWPHPDTGYDPWSD